MTSYIPNPFKWWRRDYAYIALLLALTIWFVYPRQKSVRKATKENRIEIKRLQTAYKTLQEKAKVDSLKVVFLSKKYDSLSQIKSKVIIQKQLINEKISQINERPPIVDDAELYRFFANYEIKADTIPKK